MPITPPVKITHLITMGDSLSDRGTLDKRKLLGIIPMRLLSGLSSKSPRGRFTNGFLWGDYVAATTAEQFEINELRKKLKLQPNARDNADLGDELIANGLRRNEKAFSLNDDAHVLFKGNRFARYYNEGGLTSHDYSSNFTFNLKNWFSRLILSNLTAKREQVLQDDKKYHISKEEKAETLIVEWSGANDLITVNSDPSPNEVDKAVQDRIDNVEKMIQQGYRNFVLFNLPDLSLTPRYQSRDKEARDNASKCSNYFNQQLAAKMAELSKKYQYIKPAANLSVFDVNSLFHEVYNNPEKYDFAKNKLTTPFISSEEFKKNQNNPIDKKKRISPSEGYMFWDDVHPTADMHAWLAEKFNEQYRKEFNFTAPQNTNTLTKELSSTSQNYNSKESPGAKLPQDISDLLHLIHLHAKTLTNSSDPERVQKGHLLKQFVFDVKLQKGDVEKVHEYIQQFKLDAENMEILQTHQHKIFDFFINKKTTHSEDLIAELETIVADHVHAPVSKKSI